VAAAAVAAAVVVGVLEVVADEPEPETVAVGPETVAEVLQVVQRY
jgi:ABC-type histidine transport system ATPase subunit